MKNSRGGNESFGHHVVYNHKTGSISKSTKDQANHVKLVKVYASDKKGAFERISKINFSTRRRQEAYLKINNILGGK